MSSDRTPFAAWLRERRKALDLTQAALAAQAGCSDETVRKIEAGALRPSRQLAELLAAALDLPPDERAAFVRFARGVEAPAPTTSASAPSNLNLPAPPTAFIGREREVEDVRALLLRTGVRLLTLTGPPGIGKTRLALQAAAALARQFPDGVFFVPLASTTEPSLVPSTIARSLGVRETGDLPLAETLKSYLRDRRLLLLLDNFEQVAAAAPLVAELIAAAPGLKVLVTSRIVLHLYGEHDFPVPPLSLPPVEAEPGPEQGGLEHLAGYEAVRLFIERAGAARHGFALSPENAAAIAEICRRLDGLPLAIELAANRTRTLTPQAIAERLDSRLALLEGGPQDLPPRQQALRTAIAWSYDLLTGEEQSLFRRLSTLADFGFWILDFGLLAGGEEIQTPISKIQTIESLVDKSLLRRDEAGGEPRFRMLETIREFAWEKLAESGEAPEMQRRHAACFLDLAERAEPDLQGPEQARWLERLDREHDNLRAAISYSLESGNIETAARIAAALRRFWYLRAHIAEGRRWLERALHAREELPPSLLARVLHGIGTLAWSQGDYTTARRLFGESLDIWRALGDRHGVAEMLHNLGVAALSLGDFDAARAYHEESLPVFRELGDRWSIALSLANLGLVALNKGEYESARLLHEESLALRRVLGEEQGVAQSLNNLGTVMRCQGRFDTAYALHEESLSIFRGLGDGWSVALCLSNLGLVALEQGKRTLAAAHFKESLRSFSGLGVKQGIATCLEGLAGVAVGTGNPRTAATLYAASETLRESTVAPRPPYDRASYERHLVSVRDTLNEDEFDVAWAEGRLMSLERAISYALQVTA